MPSSASISRRDYIKWGQEPASEPTSTLVLTTKSGWYIDVRILLPNPRLNPDSVPPEKDDLALWKETSKHGSLSLERLDWGFTGQATSTPSPDGKGPRHSRWEHWVDSKTKIDDPPVSDEGYMYAREDGRTLEKGRMVNPATGVDEDYEEMWADPPVEKPAHWKDDSLSGVVLKCEQKGIKGSIVRLGSYCQGVLRVGESICAERWTVGAEGDGVGNVGKWVLLARLGGGEVGCERLFAERDADLRVGVAFANGGREWVVTEVDEEW
jgi:hypothetical protein